MRLLGINRINPDRSIPTLLVPKVNNFYKLFQSYQSRQINPDPLSPVILVESVMCFNRINPNRSIPTITTYDPYALKILFQSYQSKQINPDEFGRLWLPFSRGVSIVSIQTDQSRIFCDEQKYREALELQSYQSRQINPDDSTESIHRKSESCFNRINQDRSIPTATSAELVVAWLSDAEWRNLFFERLD